MVVVITLDVLIWNVGLCVPLPEVWPLPALVDGKRVGEDQGRCSGGRPAGEFCQRTADHRLCAGSGGERGIEREVQLGQSRRERSYERLEERAELYVQGACAWR